MGFASAKGGRIGVSEGLLENVVIEIEIESCVVDVNSGVADSRMSIDNNISSDRLRRIDSLNFIRSSEVVNENDEFSEVFFRIDIEHDVDSGNSLEVVGFEDEVVVGSVGVGSGASDEES
jgi:hypothetical protein